VLLDLGKRQYQVIAVVYTRGRLMQLTVAWLFPDKPGRVRSTKSIRLKHWPEYRNKFDLIVFLHDDVATEKTARRMRQDAQQSGVLAGVMQLRYRDVYDVPRSYEERTEAAMRHFLHTHGVHDPIYSHKFLTEDDLAVLPPPAHILVLGQVTL